MTTDDSARLALHRKLEQVLGVEEAGTMMAHLPPVTWQHVATKSDVDALAVLQRGDLATHTATLRAEMAGIRTELKTEMADLKTELKTEMTGLRADVKVDMADLRTELGGRLEQAISTQTWRLVTFFGAWSALLAMIVRLTV